MRQGRLSLLTSLLDVLDSNETDNTSHALARYFLERFDDLSALNIYDVMNECYVSRTGVRRFCQSIGLANFTELKARASEWATFRSHYLAFPKAMLGEGRELSRELGSIGANIDRLVVEGVLDQIAIAMHEAQRIVIFTNAMSGMSLRNFQAAMALEHRLVCIVTDVAPSEAILRELGENDIMMVVSLSGSSAQGNLSLIEMPASHKLLISAYPDAGLDNLFDETCYLGTSAEEHGAKHHLYIEFGVPYFFLSLYYRYVFLYDEELGVFE